MEKIIKIKLPDYLRDDNDTEKGDFIFYGGILHIVLKVYKDNLFKTLMLRWFGWKFFVGIKIKPLKHVNRFK